MTGALSMVLVERWGLKANIVNLIRLLTLDAGGDWGEVSRREAAAWLKVGPNHARRLLDELVAEQVLERRKVGGRRGDFYRFRDPRDWRRVPWRFADAHPTDRVPQLVRLRLDELTRPIESAEKAVVVLFDAYGRPAKQTAVSGQVRRRVRKIEDLHPLTGAVGAELINDAGSDCAWPGATNDDGPSSTSSEPTGSAPARDGGEKTEEAGSAGRGVITLTGAAEEVRRAIVRTGTGPVKGRLLRQLEDGFRDVSADLLGDILAAIARAGRDGQRPPALAQMAVDMVECGSASLPRDTRPPAVVLAGLYDQEAALQRDLEDATEDGDEAAAEYFRKALGTCQDRIARIAGEDALV